MFRRPSFRKTLSSSLLGSLVAALLLAAPGLALAGTAPTADGPDARDTQESDTQAKMLPPTGCPGSYQLDPPYGPWLLKAQTSLSPDGVTEKAYSVLGWDGRNALGCLNGVFAVEETLSNPPNTKNVRFAIGPSFRKNNEEVNYPEGYFHIAYSNDEYKGTNANLVLENKGQAGSVSNLRSNYALSHLQERGAVSGLSFSVGPWKMRAATPGSFAGVTAYVPKSGGVSGVEGYTWAAHWFDRSELVHAHVLYNELFDKTLYPLFAGRSIEGRLSGVTSLWTSNGDDVPCTVGSPREMLQGSGRCNEWSPKVLITKMGWMGLIEPPMNVQAELPDYQGTTNFNASSSIDAPLHIKFTNRFTANNAAAKLIVENVSSVAPPAGGNNNAAINIRVTAPTAKTAIQFSQGKWGSSSSKGALLYDHANGAFQFYTGDPITGGNPNGTNISAKFTLSKEGRIGVGMGITPTSLVDGLYINSTSVGSGGFAIKTDGTISVAGTQYTSDLRLKKDVKPITGALEKVVQINGVTYAWKDEKRGKGREAGVIAQDVEKVLPEIVHTDAEGTKSVDYGKMSGLLIEAIKELKAQNAALRVEIDALKKK